MPTLHGVVRQIEQKGTSTGKTYWLIDVDGMSLSTFDAEIQNVQIGNTLDINYLVKGTYNNIKDFEVIQVKEETVGVPQATQTALKPVNSSQPTTSTWVDKNNLERERFEFEKTKQPLIIRQSSLSTAVEFLKSLGNKASEEDLFALADKLEKWVMRKE